VPIEFNRQSLSERLASTDYDRNARTLFIWEGVCMYLTPEAADSVLAFIKAESAPGSAVVFDYVAMSSSTLMACVTRSRRSTALIESIPRSLITLVGS